jgi:hypothetical protein
MPLKWKRVWISDETFESAGVFDVNGDGVPDIVSGAWWYQGPDFRKKNAIGEVKAYGEYYDDFSTIALDVNGDGFIDFVTGGWWGNTLRWRENPKGDPAKTWPEHVIAEVGNVETTRGWDIDGDGVIEILPNTPPNPEVAYYKLVTDRSGKGAGAFRKVLVHKFPEGGQGHGLGCGDIAGNGRMDIVLCRRPGRGIRSSPSRLGVGPAVCPCWWSTWTATDATRSLRARRTGTACGGASARRTGRGPITRSTRSTRSTTI